MVKAPTNDGQSKNGNVIGEMVLLTLSGGVRFTLLPASQKHLAHNAIPMALAAARRQLIFTVVKINASSTQQVKTLALQGQVNLSIFQQQNS